MLLRAICPQDLDPKSLEDDDFVPSLCCTPCLRLKMFYFQALTARWPLYCSVLRCDTLNCKSFKWNEWIIQGSWNEEVHSSWKRHPGSIKTAGIRQKAPWRFGDHCIMKEALEKQRQPDILLMHGVACQLRILHRILLPIQSFSYVYMYFHITLTTRLPVIFYPIVHWDQILQP